MRMAATSLTYTPRNCGAFCYQFTDVTASLLRRDRFNYRFGFGC